MGVSIMGVGQRGDKQFQVSKPDTRIPGLQHSGTETLLCVCQGLGTMPRLTQAPRVRPATHTPTTHGHLAEQHHLASWNKLTSCGGWGEGDMQGGNRPHKAVGLARQPPRALDQSRQTRTTQLVPGTPGGMATVGWSPSPPSYFCRSSQAPSWSTTGARHPSLTLHWLQIWQANSWP